MNEALDKLCKHSWKAYCISLPRCEERRQRFTTWANENNLTFTFWDAFDKRNLTPELMENKKVLMANQFSEGATACRISHEALWEHCLTHHKDIRYFFILEDDAGFQTQSANNLQIFLDSIGKISKPWSIVQFGFGTMTGSELHLISRRNPPNIYQVDFADQTHALLYTRQAIEDMLLLAKDSRFQTRPSDGLLLTFIQKKKGVVLAPKTSVIEQTDTISYISKT